MTADRGFTGGDRDRSDGIRANRLSPHQCAVNFGDSHPALNLESARIEADRCYYCFDAPCATACPTSIDVPAFIHRIAQGNTRGAADVILSANPLGGMCARVCPTETLCEQACVRNESDGRPVAIGSLQRYATDPVVLGAEARPLMQRKPATGRRIAIVGAGPAGLACAHRLAVQGHDVVVYEARPKPGGLNEYGIAAYKAVDDFAQKEVQWLLSIGGIEIRYGERLGSTVLLDELASEYDAVFLGIGLGGANSLNIEGGDSAGVLDAVDFIESVRQSKDKADVAVGRRVVVVGGGMTAIDAAVQAKFVGAEEVTIFYRRGPGEMSASMKEREWALTHGVTIEHWVEPVAVVSQPGGIDSVVVEGTRLEGGKLVRTGVKSSVPADMVLRAIGQRFDGQKLIDGVDVRAGKIVVDEHGKTSRPKVWAGGDCRSSSDELTVHAVADGVRAATSICEYLSRLERQPDAISTDASPSDHG